jgi:5-(carboxyamino)imidazole ribonucleotide mutase
MLILVGGLNTAYAASIVVFGDSISAAYGKSTLLENMAIQDIRNGNGFAFIDPHGKTADLLLDYIPENRMKDVLYFAPFDMENPISFNVMEDVGPDKRHLVVSGLMSAFKKIWVAVVMGSDSDWSVMKDAAAALKELGVSFEAKVVSAHRTPEEMMKYARALRKRGVRVVIAGAGGAAHLPGMMAALTELPVIGVPVPVGVMQGEDALWSIVQMPKGVPVATVAIGGAWNAGILAAQILGAGGYDTFLDRVKAMKVELRNAVLKKKINPSS